MYERKDRWCVGEWMTPDPKTISPDFSVRAAFFEMRHAGYRHLVVIDQGRLAGMVTDRDLRRPDISDEPDGWHEFYNLEDDYEVRHVMTTEVHTVAPGDRLEKALAILIDNKFGALPVVDKRQTVIGILTSYDLLRALQETLPEVRAEA